LYFAKKERKRECCRKNKNILMLDMNECKLHVLPLANTLTHTLGLGEKNKLYFTGHVGGKI